MIVFPILLALCSWLLLLWLCNQHKYLNIFEQLCLWFVAALSLFVLELFFGWLLFNRLSLLWPLATFFVLLWLFIHRIKLHPHYFQEVFGCIRSDLQSISQQFLSYKPWKKILVLAFLIYALVKMVMIFSINTHMPTFDEDAVAGWDIKTKIFAENKSLVLDTTNPEYFGTDYGRYPFAGIADTYFLLPYPWFVNGLSNIISPLIYLFALLLLLGIFLRKTEDVFWSSIIGYAFCSLPFVFIHGVGSYRNFPAGVVLFLFVFYLIDQLFPLNRENSRNVGLYTPLLLIAFLSSVVRNEWVMLTGISFLVVIVSYHVLRKNNFRSSVTQLRLLFPVILWYIIDKIIFGFYPVWSVLNTWGTNINSALLTSFFTNISQPGVFVAPFQQMFYHPDYILLFVLFFISLIVFSFFYKKIKEIRIMFFVIMILLFIFIFILYANLGLWLLTHFAFIRYPVSIILFLIYFIWSVLYVGYENKND